MRQTGTFMKNEPINDESGGQSDNYVALLTCRGRLRKMKGGKALEQGAFVMNKGYEWICRYQAAIVIDTDTAIQINGQMYRITDWEMVDEIPHFYRLTLSLFQ